MSTQLKERPIILTAEEVNAVLAGDKTQHRMSFDFEFKINTASLNETADDIGWSVQKLITRAYHEAVYDFECPFGAIGDRLWVQEDHRPISWAFEDGEVTIEYRDGKRLHPHYLTEEELETNPNDDYPFAVVEELLARNVPILKDRDCFDFSNPDNLPHWRSADVMPQFASRLLLEITDIRIERVQDITHSDSVREAAFTFYPKQAVPPLSAFPRYWMEKHGDDAWRLNPWVWVIEFKKVND